MAIWIGFDHILFLLSLLLPAVLVARRGDVAGGHAVSPGVLGRVQDCHFVHRGSFDHAESRAAGGDFAALASVESAIATSVVLAALNTSFPWYTGGAGCCFRPSG